MQLGTIDGDRGGLLSHLVIIVILFCFCRIPEECPQGPKHCVRYESFEPAKTDGTTFL